MSVSWDPPLSMWFNYIEHITTLIMCELFLAYDKEAASIFLSHKAEHVWNILCATNVWKLENTLNLRLTMIKGNLLVEKTYTIKHMLIWLNFPLWYLGLLSTVELSASANLMSQQWHNLPWIIKGCKEFLSGESQNHCLLCHWKNSPAILSVFPNPYPQGITVF